jgi:hypothetical protein
VLSNRNSGAQNPEQDSGFFLVRILFRWLADFADGSLVYAKIFWLGLCAITNRSSFVVGDFAWSSVRAFGMRLGFREFAGIAHSVYLQCAAKGE